MRGFSGDLQNCFFLDGLVAGVCADHATKMVYTRALVNTEGELLKAPNGAVLGEWVDRLMELFEGEGMEEKPIIYNDEGSEFKEHFREILKLRGITIENNHSRECDPRSPWQKGLVENAVKLVKEGLMKTIGATAQDDPRHYLECLENVSRGLNRTPRRTTHKQTPLWLHEALPVSAAGDRCDVTDQWLRRRKKAERDQLVGSDGTVWG